MQRVNRHYIPGYVWRITHRCHKKEFLLKFIRDIKKVWGQGKRTEDCWWQKKAASFANLLFLAVLILPPKMAL